MAVAGPVLLTSRSALGVTAVVVAVAESLLGSGSAVSLEWVAGVQTRAWSVLLASRWTRSVKPMVAPAASSGTEQVRSEERRVGIECRPGWTLKLKKKRASGRTSLRTTLWASSGPGLVTATW